MSSSKPSRAVVDSAQLSTLAASYTKHFEKYSNGRTQVVQIIPAAVWKEVYEDYLVAYPESTISEKTLKERLRETLTELNTGTSNEKRSGTAVLQSDEVLKKIRLTDGHASRNVLSHRANLVLGKPTFLSPPPSPVLAADNNNAGAAPAAPVIIAKPLSKVALLEKQVNTIASIGSTLATTVTQQDVLIKSKAASASKREALMEIKIRRQALAELKDLHEMGLLTIEEMKEKAAGLMK